MTFNQIILQFVWLSFSRSSRFSRSNMRDSVGSLLLAQIWYWPLLLSSVTYILWTVRLPSVDLLTNLDHFWPVENSCIGASKQVIFGSTKFLQVLQNVDMISWVETDKRRTVSYNANYRIYIPKTLLFESTAVDSAVRYCRNLPPLQLHSFLLKNGKHFCVPYRQMSIQPFRYGNWLDWTRLRLQVIEFCSSKLFSFSLFCH